MKIMVIGGGISGSRFVDSFVYDNDLFIVGKRKKGKAFLLSKTYNLSFLTYNQLVSINSLNNFDCIVLSVPVEEKIKVLKLLNKKKYFNKIIIEKPFALSIKEMKKTLKLLSHNKFEICYPRRLNPKDYFIQKNIFNNYDIVWPIAKIMSTKEYLIHLLPHLIDWILMAFNIEVVNNLSIVCSTNKTIIFKLNEYNFRINFLNNGWNNIMINNQEYKWPDYIRSNREILDVLLNNNYSITTYNQIYNNTLILEKIIEVYNE